MSSRYNKDESAQDKPRKLEEDTAQYLSEITKQFEEIPITETEDRSILVENVLNEIYARTASAACDRRTNYILEQLCAEASLESTILLLQKWTTYVQFLARNRFASHIVQTLLARLSHFLHHHSHTRSTNTADTADVSTAPTIISPETMQAIENTILDFARPLLYEIPWLAKEMSASHVLRSLICLLVGLPPIAEKKSKHAKHQHSVLHAVPLADSYEPLHYYIRHAAAAHDTAYDTVNPADNMQPDRINFPVPNSWLQLLLDGLEESLFGVKMTQRDLQEMIAANNEEGGGGQSSNACLTLLMRVLAHPLRFLQLQQAEAEAAADKLADTSSAMSVSVSAGQQLQPKGLALLQLLFNVAVEVQYDDDEATVSSSVFYAMGGDSSGSYFLETMIEVAYDLEGFLLPLLHATVLGDESGEGQEALLYGYIEDNYGNFVIQAIFRRCSSELQNGLLQLQALADKKKTNGQPVVEDDDEGKKSQKKDKKRKLATSSSSATTAELTATDKLLATSPSTLQAIIHLLSSLCQALFSSSSASSSPSAACQQLILTKPGVIYWLLQALYSWHAYEQHAQSSSQADQADNSNSNSSNSSMWIEKTISLLITTWGINSNNGSQDSSAAATTVVSKGKDKGSNSNNNSNSSMQQAIVKYLNNKFTTSALPATATAAAFGKGSKKAATAATADPSSSSVSSSALSADSHQLLLCKILALCLQNPLSSTSAAEQATTSSIFIAQCISALDLTAFSVIATSGSFSKALIDPFIVYCSHPSHQPAGSELLKQLSMRIVLGSSPSAVISSSTASPFFAKDLAQHYVGQHIVKRIYDASDLRGREKWVQTLLNSKAELQRNKEGRNMMAYMNIEGYVNDAATWRSEVKAALKLQLQQQQPEKESGAVVAGKPTTKVRKDDKSANVEGAASATDKQQPSVQQSTSTAEPKSKKMKKENNNDQSKDKNSSLTKTAATTKPKKQDDQDDDDESGGDEDDEDKKDQAAGSNPNGENANKKKRKRKRKTKSASTNIEATTNTNNE